MEPEEIPAVSEEGKQKPDCTLPAAGEEMSSAGDANVSGEGQSGAKVEDANEEQAAAPEKPLSKNQLKKLKKQAQRNELKRQKKLAKAEQRKKREEELLAKGITPEWLKKSRPRPEGELTMGQRLKAKEHSEFRKRLQASGYRIVIDLGFDDKMTEKEIGSLVKQVTYVHNSNKNAAKPCTVHLTGMGPVMTEAMNKKSTGHANWIEFTMSTKEFTECFPKEDLVYLTADSPDELSELTNDKVYIIGGIVDRNRHKMITQEKAEKLGVATARLPKLNELRMESSHVLAVNHVYDILLRVVASDGDFKAAAEAVVPSRKRTQADAKGLGGQGKKRRRAQRAREASETAADNKTDDSSVAEPTLQAETGPVDTAAAPDQDRQADRASEPRPEAASANTHESEPAAL